MRKFLWALGATLASTALSGCHTKPTIEVVDARVTGRTAEAVLVEFDLDATNPNDFDLPMHEASYSLSVDGRQVFHGARSAEATLGRGSTQRIVLPVPVPAAGASGERRYLLTGSIQYVTPSELADVFFDARLIRPSVGFSDRGVLDLGPTLSPAPVAPSAAPEQPPSPATPPGQMQEMTPIR